MLNEPDQILTPTDTADYLHVSVDTLYAWRYKNYGPPAAKVGRHLRWRRSDVDTWLDQQVAS